MKRFCGGLLIAAGAAVLAVGVLAGIEILLAKPKRQRAAVPGKLLDERKEKSSEGPKERKFSIKRTKSEVGFVYWILEGYGPYKCYMLCDTWDEAVEQARLKLSEVDAGLVAV